MNDDLSKFRIYYVLIVCVIALVFIQIFTVISINKNTEILQKNINRPLTDIASLLVENAELSRIWQTYLLNPEKLEQREMIRGRYLMNIFMKEQDYYFQINNTGMSTGSVWSIRENALKPIIKTPGYRDWSKTIFSNQTTEEFRFYLQQLIEAELRITN